MSNINNSMRKFTHEQVNEAIVKTASMQAAAKYLKCSYSVFKTIAKKYNLFAPNPAGRGTEKPRKYKTKNDVFKKDEFIPSGVLRKWYFKEHEYKCFECGIVNWNNKPITLEIDHINGNRLDSRESNLRVLCPNCHSLTDSFRSSNFHKYKNGSPAGFKKSYLKLG